MNPRLTVVIPVRNGAATLLAQLEALAAQRAAPPFEVVISDNGSTDNLAEVVEVAKARWPALMLRSIDSSETTGIGFARNRGALAAFAPLLAFCDSDDRVESGWVAAMVAGLENFDGVGGVLDERALNEPDSQPQAHVSNALPIGLRFLPYAVGANCGVRRSVLEELGGFRTDFPNAAEDVDFFWRLQLAGYRLGFVPDSVVAYRHLPTLAGNCRKWFRYGIGTCQLVAAHKGRVPRERLSKAVVAWCKLLLQAPYLAVPRKRKDYLRRLSAAAGQAVGSLRYRVLHLV